MKHPWIDVEVQLPKSGEIVLCLVRFFDIEVSRDLKEVPMVFEAKKGWSSMIPTKDCYVYYWRPRDVIPEV